MKYKKVLILGFGVTGQAVARFFAKKGIKHVVTDKKDESQFDPKLLQELTDSGFTKFLFGTEHVGDITDYDLIMATPGASYKNPILAEAIEKGVEIKNDVTLFLEEWRGIGKSIGVTGSNGKSTIVSLIHNMISKSGYDSILVGNIGESPLDYLIQNPKHGTVAVLELSSYQLETFKPEHATDVAMISNLSSNHLERYDGNFQEYADAKMRIANHVTSKFIINIDNDETNKYVTPKIGDFKDNLYAVSLKTDITEAVNLGAYSDSNGNIFVKANHKIIFDPARGLKMKGQHNLYNIALSLLAFDLIGLDYTEKTEMAIREFPGLEHRIEFVSEINGVTFINDSKSTSPDATRAAIESFSSGKNVILIMGGLDKGMNFKTLAPYLEQCVKQMIILPGDAQEKIINACELANIKYELVPDMMTACEKSLELAENGEVVLLSPSTASFNLYPGGFEERGADFKRCVNNL